VNTFKLLLKREYWEHKGGFLWAPAAAAAGFLAMAAALGVFAWAMKDDTTIYVNGEKPATAEAISAGDAATMGMGFDVSVLSFAAVPLLVLAVVLFFYCLGSLYDDRRDRSVLFWKSMPISDTATVLSKVASALVVAPLIATLVAIAVGLLAFFGMLAFTAMVMNVEIAGVAWANASPFRLAAGMLAYLPVYAFWALPTVGWLMLCSAWAKSKPFLWAVLVPVGLAVALTILDANSDYDLGATWFWQHIVARALGSLVPGIEMVMLERWDLFGMLDTPAGFKIVTAPATAWHAFTTANLWIGAAVGTAMIALSIRLRRWREEG
jgi:ABC-2 type transport system permease protein